MADAETKILFVDDDVQVLAAYKRTFRKTFQVHVAQGPVDGLAAIAEQGPFAVVVSDLRMPGMDGIAFFTQIKGRFPDTVRIMLTGYADIASAMSAVNHGHVFRFLAKPCPEQEMLEALTAGVRQYRLITAEKEFIRGTLKGVIKVLTDLLAMANATAHQRCARIKRLVVDLARASDMSDHWRMELAVMLSQLGFLILPEQLLAMKIQGLAMDVEQEDLFSQHPKLGRDLLANIPRLEEIASIISFQEKHFDGSGSPDIAVAGKDIPLGARILKAALDFDALQQQGYTRKKALTTMRNRLGWYDPEILALMDPLLGEREGYARASLPLDELRPGMVLDEKLETLETLAGRALGAADLSPAKDAALKQGLQKLKVFVPQSEPSILDEIDGDLMARIQEQKNKLASVSRATPHNNGEQKPEGEA